MQLSQVPGGCIVFFIFVWVQKPLIFAGRFGHHNGDDRSLTTSGIKRLLSYIKIPQIA